MIWSAVKPWAFHDNKRVLIIYEELLFFLNKEIESAMIPFYD